MSLLHEPGEREPFAELSRFRADFYGCLSGRGDALFELADAVLCTDGPVRSLVDLALAPEHRRGHGALYGGLNHGRIEVDRLRRTLAGLPLPKAADGRIVLAVDVSPWLRPDAATVPDRSFCHTYGRGEAKHQMIPGWPYSIVAALETGRTSWTAMQQPGHARADHVPADQMQGARGEEAGSIDAVVGVPGLGKVAPVPRGVVRTAAPPPLLPGLAGEGLQPTHNQIGSAHAVVARVSRRLGGEFAEPGHDLVAGVGGGRPSVWHQPRWEGLCSALWAAP
jgi:hypothetical protein